MILGRGRAKVGKKFEWPMSGEKNSKCQGAEEKKAKKKNKVCVIMLNTQCFRSYRHIYFFTSEACLKPRPYLKVIEVRMCEQNNGQLMSGKILS